MPAPRTSRNPRQRSIRRDAIAHHCRDRARPGKIDGGCGIGASVHAYCVAGLSVSSELALPGLIAMHEADAPDVTIRRRPVSAALDAASACGPNWQIAGDRFLMRVPQTARFLLTAGREIAFETETGTSLDDVAIFLVGTVFGILLHQRGHIALHASAVRVNGTAVLFCGPSGAGKSTIAAALGQHGYPLVTDDLCGIALGRQPMAQPDGRQLKLWAQAIEQLDLTRNRGTAVRRRAEKYYVDAEEAFTEALPIGAVYVLREARPPHAPGIERPTPIDAALLLRRNAYRPGLVGRMGQRVAYFQAAAAIANAAGIFYLTQEFDFAALPLVIRRLEDHWAEIGLAPRPA